ncbi:MAG: TIGR02450 family Trp-rich protein [Colwellia sp.]
MKNRVSPKALLHSKWTKVNISNKEKHFMITTVQFNEEQQVINCVIEALMSKNEYSIDWRDLKSKENWLMGRR